MTTFLTIVFTVVAVVFCFYITRGEKCDCGGEFEYNSFGKMECDECGNRKK